MSVQLLMFEEQTSLTSTSSPSVLLAKTLASLESVKGWTENEVALSLKQYGLSPNADHELLCGRMLKEHSAAMMAKTLRQSSKPLPTLGAIDLNGNCLIHRGFYLKTESASTLSDILQHPAEIGEEFFLSQNQVESLTSGPQKSHLHYSILDTAEETIEE